MEDHGITSTGDVGIAEREGTGVLGRVRGLVGSLLFTAGGAAVGAALGPSIFWPSVIAAFGTLLALQKVRESSPLNLALLYGFATLEGLVVGAAAALAANVLPADLRATALDTLRVLAWALPGY